MTKSETGTLDAGTRGGGDAGMRELGSVAGKRGNETQGRGTWGLRAARSRSRGDIGNRGFGDVGRENVGTRGRGT